MDITYNFSMLMEQLKTLLYYSFLNRILILAVTAQFASMITKAIINSIKAKKIVIKNMANYGGMPSSHTVFIMSFVFGIALDKNYGFSHPLLAFSIMVSSVVMMDAVRLRGTIDKLNQILQDTSAKVQNEKPEIVFPKKIAHTTKEIISGVVFAFIYTFVFYLFFYSLFGK
jgi:uncharacterized protein